MLQIKKTTLFLLVLVSISFVNCNTEEDCPLCTSPPISLSLKLVDKNTNENLLAEKKINISDIKVINLKTNEVFPFDAIIEGKFGFLTFNFGWDTQKHQLLLKVANKKDTKITVQVRKNNSKCCLSANLESVKILGNHNAKGEENQYILKL